jgi:hypothetical protein
MRKRFGSLRFAAIKSNFVRALSNFGLWPILGGTSFGCPKTCVFRPALGFGLFLGANREDEQGNEF